ncbi:hypothetical protein ONS95_004121 [Cadophora gregata]|uniref:uncharacterized protein n=1 Tax=Cadophora gregata TaxID=51156 RepID=UPI0026DD8FD1|nr:uncharacterized protein ONS95_004121 [Cadophora gregata]KAK0105518.1 hypothetical protein ONS96_004904 [Cadophora gregata f. sp. sojae]KAK0105589.1 hypothetical protein ONS95_004121 [Cadophora gregata]
MILRAALAHLVLLCAVSAHDVLRFTMGVTDPALVPGEPFSFTWTGGQPSEPVYIVRKYYFGNTPNQDILYSTEDILSNAPNNGSWTYNVPLDIFPGRYSFSIGYNPFMLSDQSGIFTILPSQTSKVTDSAPPATTNTAFQSYRGCGLPPLPDFTYTGYQPPCTVTSFGHIRTIYPIVPEGLSASFFGTSYLNSAPPITSLSGTSTTAAASVNTAFATGVYAQALQCPTPVTPSTTKLTASGTTTIFSLIGCTPTSIPNNNDAGICHTSGYSTFSVSGTTSVCCPGGWSTTPLNSDLFCFTSMAQIERRAALDGRQASTQTLVASPDPLIAISGLAFTRAGLVTAAVDQSSSVSSPSGKLSTSNLPTVTGSAAASSTAKSGGITLSLRAENVQVLLIMVGLLYLLAW